MPRSEPVEFELPPPEDDYWTLTRRPLNSLVFLVPLLVLYEWGVRHSSAANAGALRNGADAWLRWGLGTLGLADAWLLPGLVAGGLLVWHVAGRYRWVIAFNTYFGMLAESLLFALCLVLIGQAAHLGAEKFGSELATVGVVPRDAWNRSIGFIGAGIYEEVLFRLALLPLVIGVLRLIRLPASAAVIMAVFITSVLFSAAHFVGPGADSFERFSFFFRTIAGAFFAVLFLSRGFGITVGAHAGYDLLVGLALVSNQF